jgi:hypothetical protein
MLMLAIASCTRPQPEQAAAAAPLPDVMGCVAQASRDWSAVGSQYYLIDVDARGTTCTTAQAVMRIKSREGAVLFERVYPVADVPLAFNPNNDRSGLRADLEAWTENTSDTQTADWLPAWPAGADKPPNFQPAVSRNQYEAARGAQGPLFCYPDGAESNACVAMAGDHATFLGSLIPERL